MKQYDKNSLIGFVLMAVILIVFNTFFFPEIPQEKKLESHTIEKNIIEGNDKKTDFNNKFEKPDVEEITNEQKQKLGIFADAHFGKETFYSIENEKIKITVSNKGGRIISVIMKDYQTYDSSALDLMHKEHSSFNLQFSADKFTNTSNLFFDVEQSQNSINLKLKADQNHYVEYVYTLTNDFLVDFDINLVGMEDVIPEGIDYLNLEWQMKTPHTEKSKKNQDMYTGIHYQYSSDNEVDYLSFSSTDNDEINSRLNWVAFKQQFFSSILIAKDKFQKSTNLTSTTNDDIENVSSTYIKDLAAKFELPYYHKNNERLSFQFLFVPNHYKTLESYNSGFEELIPLGWGIFGWVNQYIIINIFDLLNNYFTSFGIIILLLTLIIKLGLSPFTYKAFLSQAKMKVLKPEIETITEKNKGKDQMKVQQETMSLYRKAGVNPMGGCLPMLFQFPILIAMFQFFPASIELRQESFLWADDLSSYDSIYNLGFNIPFYGDHISLFTLLMTISTLLYTRMNSSMATGQMAQMKWMMYLMPIMFLGFFNNYAAGLTYYYFLANMFTMTQQYFMMRFVDEKGILAQIEANKKKPAKPKSKFQKKLEEMQKQQEKKMRNK